MSARFCTECGAALPAESKFCVSCGAKVAQETKQQNNEQAKKPAPKQQKRPKQKKTELTKAEQVISAAGRLTGATAFALPSGGEMVFTQPRGSVKNIIPEGLTPVKYLLGGIKRLILGIKEGFTDKRKLIPTLVLAVIWLVLIVLPIFGINPAPVRFLSFLTFARGGTGGGLVGIVGGLIGKGVFAFFVTSLLLPLTGGKSFAGIGKGLKNLLGSFALKDKTTLIKMFLGAGLALIVYNFLTGSASLQNSMVGIAAFLVSLRALANKTGFLRGFIGSLLNKLNKDGSLDTADITQVMAGWTLGFAIGVLLSGIGIGGIGYLAGILLLIVLAVLKTVSSTKKEAVKG